jgi:hypothetical protein
MPLGLIQIPRNASWNPSPDVYESAAYSPFAPPFRQRLLAMTFGILLAASPTSRLIGGSGANVISRVLGILLTALAVRTILSGLGAGSVCRDCSPQGGRQSPDALV